MDAAMQKKICPALAEGLRTADCGLPDDAVSCGEGWDFENILNQTFPGPGPYNHWRDARHDTAFSLLNMRPTSQ